MTAHTGSDLRRQVRDALIHLNDLAYLQTHPLVPAGGGRGSASVLRRTLLEAIEGLRPAAHTPTASPARRRHRMLVMRYADGLNTAAVQAQLGIGKSEYHREHQRALVAVVSLLTERWGDADGQAAAEVSGSHAVQLHRKWRTEPPNLPTPLTGLIGREAELSEVSRLLGSCRLVTLTGPPGAGKTRLSLEVARAVAADFPDGVHFVPLAAISQASLALPTIADALGVQEATESSVEATLAQALGPARALLVLDNFEQIVEAAPTVAELLEACPQLKALVTSRVKLRVRGEHGVLVGPLAVPGPQGPLTAAAIDGYPAVQLFVERAREVDPHFELTDANSVAVAGICRRLEGLPLALELAAAGIDVLPPDLLLERLERRLAVLADGPKDLPARHRTLREAIASSYDLLSAGQQAVLRRLAVFAGGWTTAAAEAVLSMDAAPVIDGLGTLVRSSLVRRSAQESRGEPRFDMLETIREYALERMVESGEDEILRARHADHYLRLADQSPRSAVEGLELEALDHVDWWQRAEWEQDNLRAAFQWAIEHAQGEKALRLSGALAELWTLRGGHYVEGRARLTEALEMTRMGEMSRVRALALERVGGLAIRAGDYLGARRFLHEAIQAYERLGDRRAVVLAIRQLKQAFRREGNLAQARALDEKALGILEEMGDTTGIAQVLASLGHHFVLLGEPATARAYVKDALALAPTPLAFCVLGMVACDEDRWTEARSNFESGLAIYRQLGDRDGIARALEGFAGLAATEEMHTRAINLLAAAAALRDATQTPLPPSWQPDLERRLRPAVESLTAEEYAVAWERGARMSADEAMDRALSARSHKTDEVRT